MYSVIGDNFLWMAYNILLALVPVLFARLFYKTRTVFLKIIFFAVWLIFVPNTIYIFTDILHLMEQISKADLFGGAILLAQYTLLFICGFLTYMLSLYPIGYSLRKMTKKNADDLIIGINFLIGFGVVLGRIQRLNSWDVIFGAEKVINSAILTVTSPKMILLSILFGLFGNFIYFLFRKNLTKYAI